MKLTLAGPDDMGDWYLVDSNGQDFRIVDQWVDHLYAAWLFGWQGEPDDRFDDARIEAALDYLMEHIGDEIDAPIHIAELY